MFLFGGRKQGGKRKRSDDFDESSSVELQDPKRQREGIEESMLVDGGAVTKTPAWQVYDQAARRRFLEVEDDPAKDNSSFQRPLASHDHNIRMQTRGTQLQAMPDSVLVKIFLEAGLIQKETIQVPLSQDFLNSNKMSLLYVSHRFHQLAVRLFWSANSFSIRIDRFNAGAILPWWTHVDKLRTEVGQGPIQQRTPGDWLRLMGEAKGPVQRKLRELAGLDVSFNIRRNEAFLTKPVCMGDIKLDVPYTPHWANLKEWLRLYHEGKVPSLASKDVGSSAEWKELQQLVGLFLTVGQDKSEDWAGVEKRLEGWRYTLTFADSRWAFENGEDEDVADAGINEDDEIQADILAKLHQVPGDYPNIGDDAVSDDDDLSNNNGLPGDSHSLSSSPPVSNQMGSSPYRTARETLGSAFKQTPMQSAQREFADSDSEGEELEELEDLWEQRRAKGSPIL